MIKECTLSINVRGVDVPWYIMYAIDAEGLVRAKTYGGNYKWCLRDMNDAIAELEGQSV